MDLIAKGLNSVYGSKKLPRPVDQRELRARADKQSADIQKGTRQASLLTGADQFDVDAVTKEVEENMKKFQETSYKLDEQGKEQAKSFLGGLSPSEYLTAWKGYVASRASQVEKGAQSPSRRQTFLTGGI